MLGCNINLSTLEIVAIEEAGALSRHNRMNPDCACKLGDRFVNVNGVTVTQPDDFQAAIRRRNPVQATIERLIICEEEEANVWNAGSRRACLDQPVQTDYQHTIIQRGTQSPPMPGTLPLTVPAAALNHQFACQHSAPTPGSHIGSLQRAPLSPQYSSMRRPVLRSQSMVLSAPLRPSDSFVGLAQQASRMPTPLRASNPEFSRQVLTPTRTSPVQMCRSPRSPVPAYKSVLGPQVCIAPLDGRSNVRSGSPRGSSFSPARLAPGMFQYVKQ